MSKYYTNNMNDESKKNITRFFYKAVQVIEQLKIKFPSLNCVRILRCRKKTKLVRLFDSPATRAAYFCGGTTLVTSHKAITENKTDYLLSFRQNNFTKVSRYFAEE